MALSAGDRLGRYEIGDPLGAGGMGEVYRALDPSLGREVALKVLPAEMAADADRLERFEREARTLAALDHPNIVQIYSVDEVDGVRFITMQLVEGRQLSELIPDNGLPLDRVVEIAAPLVDALGAAHERGITHRDLKPSNIMVDGDGWVKLLDFGLAKLRVGDRGAERSELSTEAMTRAGTVLGTVPYMSPEQVEGKTLDERSDLFSLGVVLYEMVTGERPFHGDSSVAVASAILRDTPCSVSEIRKNVPDRLGRIISRCLEKDPDDRHQNAREVGGELADLRHESDLVRSAAALRRPKVAIPIIVVSVLVLVAAGWLWRRAADRRWAREQALPEIQRLVDASWREYSEAYELAVEAERYIPNDPRLAELISQCSRMVSVNTEPQGAEIFVKPYASPSDEWERLGSSPLEEVRLPIGIMRWKIEKPGYETCLAAASTWNVSFGEGPLLVASDLGWTLDEAGVGPPEMVRIAGAETSAGVLGDFYMDRNEVTNREYKNFVDVGGYRSREYWEHNFVDEETVLTWEEAMALFVDQTGRPGPALWQAGDFPEGQADYPASGISWYEAAAYAKFVGKTIPTGTHWGLARGDATTLVQFPQLGGFEIFAPFSNFDGRGPREVGSHPNITAFGAYDMAGNVREWCFNETQGGRLVRGGSWSDATYMFNALSRLPPMDRSPQNGFRCARYPEPDMVSETAFAKVDLPASRDVYAEEPVSDQIFEVYKERFAYDRTDLEARVESTDQNNEYWIHETVTYGAAYGGERVIGHLFLPQTASPPYQTVIYFPGSGALFQTSSVDIEDYFEVPIFMSFIMKSGRAVLFPVYQGTFERRAPSLESIDAGESSHRHLENLVQLVRDFRRSIDYLETRDDIDHDKLAYYGLSWGATHGAIIPAVEDRLRASVLLSGGLSVRFRGREILDFRPEADPVNYLPRMRVPTLMINGRYDMILPLETSIQPMFDLMGTPAEHKQLLLFDTDHIPPRNEFIKGTLSWLDRYLGPVQPR